MPRGQDGDGSYNDVDDEEERNGNYRQILK